MSLVKCDFQLPCIILKCSFFQVHPVCIPREPKVEKEDQFKVFKQNQKLMQNKNEELGNQTIFDKVILN
jgi:hypothetical protein